MNRENMEEDKNDVGRKDYRKGLKKRTEEVKDKRGGDKRRCVVCKARLRPDYWCVNPREPHYNGQSAKEEVAKYLSDEKKESV